MSRNRHSMSQAAPQFVPQVNGAAMVSEFKQDILSAIQEGKMPTPTGRLQLSARLGYPDFEPATSDADEDQLTDERLKTGWSSQGDMRRVAKEESPFAEDSMEYKIDVHQIQAMRQKLGIPEPQHGNRRTKKHREKSTLFPEPGPGGDMKTFLNNLANPQCSLAQLMEKGVPYVMPIRSGLHVHGYTSRAKKLFDLLSCDAQNSRGAPMGASGGGAATLQGVPLVRAMWFVKVTILKEFIDKDKNEEPLSVEVKPEALEKRTDEFTSELTKYLLEHFLDFARSKGQCVNSIMVEQLVRKWAYMVRFADWCYGEGVINRAIYCKWVVDTVRTYMREPEQDQCSANWSVMELMSPLILNVLPDLCRLDDELPHLITVCIHRYMRECVVLKPSREFRLDQPSNSTAPRPPEADAGVPEAAGCAGFGGGLPGTMLAGESSVSVLGNVKKLVKSLLFLNPEAYLALSPDVQTAWRLIENEASVREIDAAALKSALRKEPDPFASVTCLSLSEPWADDLRKASKLAEECEADKLMFEYLDRLDKCCRRPGGCDVQKLKEVLEAERERERERLRSQYLAPWQKVFQEHSRARCIVRIVCSWSVSHCREHMGESVYIAASLLKGLSEVLMQVFNVDVDSSDSSGQVGQQETLLCGSAEGVVGVDLQTHSNDFPLQGYLESFISSFVPKKGSEEAEMLRLECLVAELMRQNLLSHDAWLHSMISKGVFLNCSAGRHVMDASTKQQQRLLANLPFFPEARHDSFQRRVLLRNVSLLDLAPCATYYAYKVNRFLFWGPADLDNLTAGCPQGQDHLAEVTDAPDTLVTAGLFGPQRILALEWEESVKLSWLQHESKSESADSGVEGVLVARSAGVLFSTLAAVLTEAPLYVKVLLCRHICAVLKVIVHRAGHKSELELMDASEIPEDLKITEDILYRALTLLEIAADSRCMVMLLKFLLDRIELERHSGYICIATALVTHLRTVRALELTAELWKIGLNSLLKAEQAQKMHIVRRIEDLLKIMVREAQDVRLLQEHLRALFSHGRSMSPAVEGIEKMVNEACHDRQSAEAAADAAVEDLPVLAAADQSQRPDFLQAIDNMLAGVTSCDVTADLLLKRMSEVGAGEGAVVSCIVRAAVNATVKEGRSASSSGTTGIGISQCVSLLSAIESRRNCKEDLPKLALHLVIRGIMEPDSLAPMTDGTSPNTVATVDTPQPQTPFSPATPDSLPVAKKSTLTDDDAATTALRHDASLALLATLISRGLLLWEFVQRRFNMDLKKPLNPEKRLVLPMLSFVELLLTERRRGAAAIMTQMDWQRLKCMRRSQPPSEAYKMLVQLSEFVQRCDDKTYLKHHVVASMQQIMQDDAMCCIATSDDPEKFWKDCSKACNSLLRVSQIEQNLNPFRHFSFGLGSERKADILASVQTLISRVSIYSMSFDCSELRVLSAAWTGAHDEVEAYTNDGWEVWKAANATKLSLFEAQLSEESRSTLQKALTRENDKWFEHMIVEMLLAEFWRNPHKVEHLVHFAKAMGLCFQDRWIDNNNGWFESQMLQLIFALLDCEPVKRGSTSLHLCFREFIHAAVPFAQQSSDELHPEQVPGHRAAFEAAVVHLVERYGVPQRSAQPQEFYVALMKLRRHYTCQILLHIEALVTQVQAGDYTNEFVAHTGNDAMDTGDDTFSKKPSLHLLQQACVLRLQLLNAALMHLPDDDNRLTLEMLTKTVATIKSVCSCPNFMGNVLGDTLYRCALASMDTIGALTLSIDWLRERSQAVQLHPIYKTQLRTELLGEKLPRFVSEHLNAHLPVTKVRPTSSGVVRHVPELSGLRAGHESSLEEAGQAASLPAMQSATFEDDEPFDVDPWLLLEHNPQGVLKSRLANAKRHQREKLKWEYQKEPSSYPQMQQAAMGAVGGVGVPGMAGHAGQYAPAPQVAGHYHSQPQHMTW